MDDDKTLLIALQRVEREICATNDKLFAQVDAIRDVVSRTIVRMMVEVDATRAIVLRGQKRKAHQASPEQPLECNKSAKTVSDDEAEPESESEAATAPEVEDVDLSDSEDEEKHERQRPSGNKDLLSDYDKTDGFVADSLAPVEVEEQEEDDEEEVEEDDGEEDDAPSPKPRRPKTRSATQQQKAKTKAKPKSKAKAKPGVDSWEMELKQDLKGQAVPMKPFKLLAEPRSINIHAVLPQLPPDFKRCDRVDPALQQLIETLRQQWHTNPFYKRMYQQIRSAAECGRETNHPFCNWLFHLAAEGQLKVRRRTQEEIYRAGSITRCDICRLKRVVLYEVEVWDVNRSKKIASFGSGYHCAMRFDALAQLYEILNIWVYDPEQDFDVRRVQDSLEFLEGKVQAAIADVAALKKGGKGRDQSDEIETTSTRRTVPLISEAGL